MIVTGGAGFLGSHLVDRLLDEGERVTVLDELSTGRLENLREARRSRRLGFIHEDVVRFNPNAYENPHREELRNVDEIYHLASRASPPAYLAAGIATLRTGAEGTRNMLELARLTDARFLLTSTSEVYGDPHVSPQPESYRGNVDPVGPRSVYDEAKRYAEALVMAYRRTYGLDVRIARIFNTYGPRMRPDDGRVVSNFAKQAIAGRPLTVYGDGSQTRSFCYVDDMVEALRRLAARGDHQPTNVGNPQEITVLELARRIQRLTGDRSPIEHRERPQDDPSQRRPDISRAMRRLEWKPQVGLEEGLRRTIDAFRATTPPMMIK